MKNHYFFVFAFFIGFSAFSQVRGVVKDSITGVPIPYVTISVEKENFGTTAEENGEFVINVSQKSQNLVFYALGFARKVVPIAEASEVRLKPTAFELDEVVISNRLESRQKEIGKSENQIHEAFENAPRIDLKFFPYLPEYKKTKFIKHVSLVTDSKIDEATFKIHIYRVNSDGFPGEELIEKDFIVSVGKGILKTKFDLRGFHLTMPKNGIFIGFERLLIAKNMVERTITDPNTKTTETQLKYYPLMLYDSVRRDFQFVFVDGKWTKKTKPNPNDAEDKIRIYEPAITLILTN